MDVAGSDGYEKSRKKQHDALLLHIFNSTHTMKIAVSLSDG